MAPAPGSRPLSPWRLGALACALALAASCATTSALKTAREAETRQDYDTAVAEYTKLLRDNPNDKEARLGLDRARLRAAQDHHSRARRLAASG